MTTEDWKNDSMPQMKKAHQVQILSSLSIYPSIYLSVCSSIYLLIKAISIAPLQVHYYSQALPTQHGYCVGVSRRSATGNCEWRTCTTRKPFSVWWKYKYVVSPGGWAERSATRTGWSQDKELQKKGRHIFDDKVPDDRGVPIILLDQEPMEYVPYVLGNIAKSRDKTNHTCSRQHNTIQRLQYWTCGTWSGK